MSDNVDMPWGNVEVQWGSMPAVIREVVSALASKAQNDARHLTRIKWPDSAGDIQEQLRLAIGDAHKLTKAGADLRSLLSAYAHKFHEPRPVISDLARAQETSSQGFIRRYSENTMAAVESLLSADPNIGVVRAGIPSLSLIDLSRLSGPVGRLATDQLTLPDEPGPSL